MDQFKQFKQALENASDHIVITDIDGYIVYANKAAEDLTGYSKKEMLKKKPSLWGAQMGEKFYKVMWKVIKDEKRLFKGNIINKRKNGELYEAEIQITPILDKDQKITYFIGIERDISKEKTFEKQKSNFITLASHQLQTPLVIIKWYSELLLSKEGESLSDSQKNNVSEIQNAAERMSKLIQTLLNVSRIEIGNIVMKPEKCNVKEIIKETIKSLRIEIKKKNLKISESYPKKLPSLFVDKKNLHLILENLIENAIRYNKVKGSISIKVSIKKEKNIKNMIIAIKDTGMGIPQSQQSLIFNKLFRGSNIIEREPEGNGVGLYLVKAFMSHMKGKIWMESTYNKGSAFSISFPLNNKS